MIGHGRPRRLLLMAAIASLVLSACGTQLDRATIESAAGAMGSAQHSDQAVPGAAAPGTGATAGGGAPTAAAVPETSATAGPGAGGPGEPEVAAGQAGNGAGSTASGGAATEAAGSGDNGNSAAGSDEPIVIGSVGTHTGPLSTSYNQVPQGLQAWVADTNANGGINGRPIELILLDDGADPARSRSHVQTLVEEHNVVAIVAPTPTPQSLETWIGYVEDQQVPVIGGTSNSPTWQSPIVFSQSPPFEDLTFGTAYIGAQYGDSKQWGLISCTESDACTTGEDRLLNKGDAERAGLEVRYSARISLTQPDFTGECLQARNAGVELLTIISDAHTAVRVVSSCQRQNYSPQILQASYTADGEMVGRPGFEDMLVTNLTFPFSGLSTPAFKRFQAAWQKYFSGESPGPGTTMGWAAGEAFGQAAGAAGADVSRPALLEQLYRVKNERFGGMTVPLTYSQQGTQAKSCIFWLKGDAGNWTAPNGDTPDCW